MSELNGFLKRANEQGIDVYKLVKQEINKKTLPRTRTLHNVYYDKFVDNLYRFKKPEERFTIKQIQDYLLEDNNSVSDEQALQYLDKMAKDGRVLKCGTGEYQIMQRRDTEQEVQKEESVLFLEYTDFCNLVLAWKLKREMMTVRELSRHLNGMNVFLPYHLIHDYIYKMINDSKLIRYSRRRYQVV